MNVEDLAKKWHADQEYLPGMPYWKHLERVASRFYKGTVEYEAAWLHDILEDTSCPQKTIITHFGPTVLTTVRLLTNHETYDPNQYDRIKAHPFALRVKLADMSDNLAFCVINSHDPELKDVRDWKAMAARYANRIRYLTTERNT